MNRRLLGSAGTCATAILVVLSSEPVGAQGRPAAATQEGVTRTWTPPRTPDGQPDLQGFWTNQTITPLERPNGVTKEFYTTAEMADLKARIEARGSASAESLKPAGDSDPLAAYVSGGGVRTSGASTEPGTRADVHYEFKQFGLDISQTTYDLANMRTSLIIEPKDGKLPPLSPEGKQRAAARAAAREQRGAPYDAAQNTYLSERCILFGSGPPDPTVVPMVPAPYLSEYQIVQSPGYVMILTEMIHDVRIIPLDGRPPLSRNIRQYLGSSRGRWEGETLVVETTNFTDKAPFRGSSENLRVVERFRRVADDRIHYTFTMDDPANWTTPWSAEVPFIKSTGPIFEFACHEANYGLANELSGARAQEKQSLEEAAKTPPPR